jgi:hypothetical protein
VNRSSLVAAEESVDASQRRRVDVPGIATEVGDALDHRVLWRMKAVIHRRSEPERHIVAVDPGRMIVFGTEELRQSIGHALGLQKGPILHPAAGADDRVARTAQHIRSRVERAGAWQQLPGEAFLEAVELLSTRIGQIEVGEEPPDSDQQPGQQRAPDPAEASHQPSCERTGYVIREHEIQAIARGNASKHGSFHRDVI